MWPKLLLVCVLLALCSATKTTSTRSVVEETAKETKGGAVAVGDAIVAVIENRAAFLEVLLSWIKAIIQGIFGHMGSELGNFMWRSMIGPERSRRSDEDSVEGEEDSWLIPWLGHKINMDDLKLLERYILDTVDVIKSWQHRIRLIRQDEL